ncbi:GlcG/HbpS family heme-binding protein [Salinibacterium hongtaonis]|uniref:GlcG/HbpS family heme-binding protein n=1 Tax=Homoserinimonas hongtaonis TaxID=2079791 RepID=UPI00131F41A6|nr:heme-binding protein [Salinibacterium hongtaonis]
MTITLGAARATLDEAMRLAEAAGLRGSVSIADEHGRLVCSARMDGASWFTLGVANAKAQTAATFKRPSDSLGRLKDDYPELLRHIDDQLAFRVTTLPGGVPLGADGSLGGIGVSGAHPEQDLRIAQESAAFFIARR